MDKVEVLIDKLLSNNDKIRFNGFKELLVISRRNPKKLYHFWDEIAGLLKKKEVSNKYYSIVLIGNLIKADDKNKFEGMFNEFFNNIEDKSPVVSLNIAGVSGKIINAKPNLERRIRKKLLNCKKSSRCRYPDLMGSYILFSFDECFDNIKDKKSVMDFAKRQLKSSSPKTKKAAKDFLNKRDSLALERN